MEGCSNLPQSHDYWKRTREAYQGGWGKGRSTPSAKQTCPPACSSRQQQAPQRAHTSILGDTQVTTQLTLTSCWILWKGPSCLVVLTCHRKSLSWFFYCSGFGSCPFPWGRWAQEHSWGSIGILHVKTTRNQVPPNGLGAVLAHSSTYTEVNQREAFLIMSPHRWKHGNGSD